jgi:hypothetical protein
MGIIRVFKEPTETNLADLFTKSLPRVRRDSLLSLIVYAQYFQSNWTDADGRVRIRTPRQ